MYSKIQVARRTGRKHWQKMRRRVGWGRRRRRGIRGRTGVHFRRGRRRQIERRALRSYGRCFEAMLFRPRWRRFGQCLRSDLHDWPGRRRRPPRNCALVGRQINHTEFLAREFNLVARGHVLRENFRQKNQKNNESDVRRDGNHARNGVPLRIPAVFGLNEEIRFAGVENIRRDNLAQLRRHLRRLIEFIDLALLRRLYVRGNHHAAVHNCQRRVFRRRQKLLERLHAHSARHQAAFDQHIQRQMFRNAGLAGERRRVGQIRRDDGAIVHIRRQPPRRLLARLFGIRTHIGGNEGSRNHLLSWETTASSWTRRACSWMPAITRSASSSAARPAAPSTRGGRRLRTERANAPSSARSGSSGEVGIFSKLICGCGEPGSTRTRSKSWRVKSSEKYSCAWKKRILRTRSVETRLAVTLATVPVENSMRTCAISTLSVITGMPTAFKSTTGAPTSASRMSKSWIITSYTTSISRLRGVKIPRRCTSKNIGLETIFIAATTAGLNRSRCPICRMRLLRCAEAIKPSASPSDAAMGFSTSTSMPESSKRQPMRE